jgi:hypothetical protein
MAYEEKLETVTMIAGADLSSSQYLFVKTNTTAKTVVLCGDGEDAFGVLQDTPTSGQACCIAIGGVSKVKLGGTVAAGAVVSSGASGVGNVSANGDYMLGIALAGGASGEIIPVKLDKNGVDPA